MAARDELRVRPQPDAVEKVAEPDAEAAEAVHDGASEVDRRRLVEVPRRAAHLAGEQRGLRLRQRDARPVLRARLPHRLGGFFYGKEYLDSEFSCNYSAVPVRYQVPQTGKRSSRGSLPMRSSTAYRSFNGRIRPGGPRGRSTCARRPPVPRRRKAQLCARAAPNTSSRILRRRGASVR